MIFLGEEIKGLSNAIVGARLMCVNPEMASEWSSTLVMKD
jgi:hypothetical protein